MALVKPTSRIYKTATPLGAMYKGEHKVWEPPPPWKPPDIAGVAFWIDASQLTDADGTALTVWPDASGNNRPGVLAGSGAPTVRTNVLNGKSVVRFTINQAGFRWLNTNVRNNWTLAVVAHQLGGGSQRIISAIYPPMNLAFGWHGGKQDAFYDSGFATPDVGVTATTAWKLYSGDGISTTNLARYYSNGVLLNTNPGHYGWGAQFALSGYDINATAGSESSTCEVAEVVLYDHRLTDPERQQVEGYLRTKWGL